MFSFFKKFKKLDYSEIDIITLQKGLEYPVVYDPKCLGCEFQGLCQAPGIFNYSPDKCFKEEFDPDKKTILLIDDNRLILTFLEEDLQCLHNHGVIDITEFNILSISGSHAAYNFYCIQQQAEGLNIEYAIIDTCYTGSLIKDGVSHKYSGVDIYKSILKYNPKIKALFYTNSINNKLKSNIKMVRDFFEISGLNLFDYTLLKTTLNIRKRRSEIAERLFGKDLERHCGADGKICTYNVDPIPSTQG